MSFLSRLALLSLALLLAFALSPAPARAEKIRLAVQASGTFAWEIAAARALGLDKSADLELEAVELATTEAGKIALIGGEADVILSDWLWVARERSLGRDLLFSPHSTALGAVMAKDAKSFTQPSDFIGKKLGVAGGPLDKSWLLLQAWALKKGVDLKAQATLVFGAPPLLAEKLAQGELDAALEFWTFCARLEARGFARAVDMADVERELGARGPVIITGYVFTPVYAAQHGAALNRFLVMMAEARKQLAGDEALFAKIAPSTGPLLAGAPDAATLAIFRRAYRAGLPDRPLEEYQTDAAALYKVLAQIGGPQLVGPATELDPKIFFSAP